MPVMPCCCCCKCERVSAGLANFYTVDLSGTWDWSGCAGNTPCIGSVTTVDLPQNGEGVCDFIFEAEPATCIDGKALQLAELELPGGDCCRWILRVVFFDADGTDGGLDVTYVQDPSNCADPTGTYRLSLVTVCGHGNSCPTASIPETITVEETGI